MLVIILTIIVSLMLSYAVTEGASRVSIQLGTATLYNIPLFSVVFASMIIGMILASVTTIKNLIGSKLMLFLQKQDLKKSYKTSDNLNLKVNKLEEENSALKEQLKELARPKKISE